MGNFDIPLNEVSSEYREGAQVFLIEFLLNEGSCIKTSSIVGKNHVFLTDNSVVFQGNMPT